MQPGSMMPMNHKGIPLPHHPLSIRWGEGRGEGCGLGRFFKTSFPRIILKLFRGFVGSSRVEGFFGGWSRFLFRVNWSRITGDGFPRISALHDALWNAVKVENLRASH